MKSETSVGEISDRTVIRSRQIIKLPIAGSALTITVLTWWGWLPVGGGGGVGWSGGPGGGEVFGEGCRELAPMRARHQHLGIGDLRRQGLAVRHLNNGAHCRQLDERMIVTI